MLVFRKDEINMRGKKKKKNTRSIFSAGYCIINKNNAVLYYYIAVNQQFNGRHDRLPEGQKSHQHRCGRDG